MTKLKYSKVVFILVIAYLAFAPVLPVLGITNIGLQQSVAVGLLYGALALTYDLLFGFTGLLSFGHALFFASGMYFTAFFMATFELNLFIAIPLSLGCTLILALLIGGASLRTKGITFAMVTLAFGEAGHVMINRTLNTWTGGVNGLPMNAAETPDFFLGVLNTKYLYWLALAVLAIVYAVVWWITESSAGRVFAALRDNETRVSVLGLNPNKFKLFSFVIAGTLAALVGAAMLVVGGSASPIYAAGDATIAILLMVIIGGAISRWGAVLGGMLYSLASTRLQDVSSGSALESLPHWLKGPLGEPTLILGIIFILIVMYSPGGIAGGYYRIRARLTS